MIDKNKKYTTRDGCDVRIYATDCGGDYPVHGAILGNGKWFLSSWTVEGEEVMDGVCNFDLIEKPQEHTVKILFWRMSDGQIEPSLLVPGDEDTLRENKSVLAFKEITFKEGEGL